MHLWVLSRAQSRWCTAEQRQAAGQGRARIAAFQRWGAEIRVLTVDSTSRSSECRLQHFPTPSTGRALGQLLSLRYTL